MKRWINNLNFFTQFPQGFTLPLLREKLSQWIFYIVGFSGIFACLINLPLIQDTAQRGAVALYSIVYVTILLLALVKFIPFRISLITSFTLVWIVGSTSLYTGLYGSGYVCLMVLPLIANISLFRTSRIISIHLSSGLFIFVGGLVLYLFAPTLFTPGEQSNILLAWFIANVYFTLLAIAGTVSLSVLFRWLEQCINLWGKRLDELNKNYADSEEIVVQYVEKLERRMVQIHTAAEISRDISRLIDINFLLPKICELVKVQFNLYYVGVFLVERENISANGNGSNIVDERYAVLVAGSGEEGKRMLSDKHKLLVGGNSMIGWATANRKGRFALDVDKEIVRFNNPNLPRTRSELALPILSSKGGKDSIRDDNQDEIHVLGAMTVQSDQENAFDDEDLIVLQGIADSLAAAIENARLYQQVNHEARRAARDALGYELHEIANFVHGTLQIRIEIAKEKLLHGDYPSLHQEIERLSKSASYTLSHLRWIQNDLLHGIVIEETGLVGALEHFAELIHIPIKIHSQGWKNIPIEVEYALYKICLEAIFNSSKHAGSGINCIVTLENVDNNYELIVQDNGYGFDVSSTISRNDVYGIATMNNWVTSIGGRLTIESRIGVGTQVKVVGSIDKYIEDKYGKDDISSDRR